MSISFQERKLVDVSLALLSLLNKASETRKSIFIRVVCVSVLVLSFSVSIKMYVSISIGWNDRQ